MTKTNAALYSKTYFTIALFCILVLSCRGNCEDPNHPDCFNYDPCFQLPKAEAKIISFEIINELKVRTDSTFEDVTLQFLSASNSGTNLWEDYNYKILSSSRDLFKSFDTNSSSLIRLYNSIPRRNECKGAKLTDSTHKSVKIFQKTDFNPNCSCVGISKLAQWHGKYNGLIKGIINSNFSIEITEKIAKKGNGDLTSGASINFLSDTCLGSYWIDKNYGIKWFKSDVILNQPNSCNNKLWFEEVYGVIDGKDIIIRGKNNRENYEFEFKGERI